MIHSIMSLLFQPRWHRQCNQFSVSTRRQLTVDDSYKNICVILRRIQLRWDLGGHCSSNRTVAAETRLHRLAITDTLMNSDCVNDPSTDVTVKCAVKKLLTHSLTHSRNSEVSCCSGWHLGMIDK